MVEESRTDSAQQPVEATSLSLLTGLKGEDPAAWSRLVRMYGPLVYSWCRQAALKAEDAADVSQEVFCAVSASIVQFRRDRCGDTFRGWLWRITQNKIRDHFRRRRGVAEATGGTDVQRRMAELPEPLEPTSTTCRWSPSDGALLSRAIQLVRAEFTDQTWQAFWRVAVEEQSPKDVAAELGSTPAAVRQAKSRVLRRLREELGDAS